MGIDFDNHRIQYLPHRRVGNSLQVREYHAGHGGLCLALGGAGFVAKKFEPYVDGGYISSEDLERDDVIEKEIDNNKLKNIVYWHSGIPCGSWSALQSLNSTSTRSRTHPWGINPNRKELQADR